MVRTFGYTRAEALGREMAELIIPPGLRERHRNGLARYLATGDGPVLGKRFEITAVRKDGSEFPVELAICRIPTSGPPTFTGHLAEALVTLAGGDARGLMHVAGAGSCSWFDFARAILSRARSDCVVEPCTTAEFPRPARRPQYSVLASELGGASLPAWQDGLDAYLGVRA